MMDMKENFFPNLPDRLRGLADIASSLWWTWPPATRMVFKMLDRQGWKESLHNPVKMLKELPREILESAAHNPSYLEYYDEVFKQFQGETRKGQFCLVDTSLDPNIHFIAYFSAEYGLHHSLPFYAGGLGFLAGDFIKECSDLRVPLVAVGFMYPEGYVRQCIREDGWQESVDQVLDRNMASIERVLDNNGRRLTVKVPLIEPSIFVSVWKVDVGLVSLYLMDTDIEENDPWNRKISARLYTGDVEHRLRQEIVLGIGGSAVLKALGIKSFIVHLNEGHAAFVLLERMREKVQEGMEYKQALDHVSRTSVFTTHTPVSAGHDVFSFSLMEKYFYSYWPALGIDRETFLKLGIPPETPVEGFNMTAFALKVSEYKNAVSRKHEEVTRKMWRSMWPELHENDIPIGHITNGVHIPTWVDPKMEILFNKYLGSDWLKNQDNPQLWNGIDGIPDEELWKTHYWLKIKLFNVIREQARQRWTRDRAAPSNILASGALLDPSILTIGFARRFATYKRADLILDDANRLKKLLNERWRPIQIIFAGKAHPADEPGKRILQKVFNAAKDPEMGGRIAFLEDYGEQCAQYMLHGVDVWLNNPLPPLEASGTSGMKAALNGVPQLSILDGWWIEGFNGKNGWAFESKDAEKNSPGEREDAKKMYQILEDEVIPLYYKDTGDGIPHDWVRIMKESIKNVAPIFCSRRMVKEYINKYYSKAFTEL